jgi:hypothetical protein
LPGMQKQSRPSETFEVSIPEPAFFGFASPKMIILAGS